MRRSQFPSRSMTEGSPAKVLVLFTLPIIAGDFCHLLYSMADALIVGRTMGVDALAAVGCTTPIVSFVSGFVIGLTGGFSIILAQRFGAAQKAMQKAALTAGGDKDALRMSFTVSVLFSFAAGLILAVLLVPLIRPVLAMLNTPAEITEGAASYMFFIIGGMPISALNFIFGASIRSLGDSKTPLFFWVLSSLVNIGLDFWFILFFRWGIAGAAAATVISQLCSFIGCAIFIVKKRRDLLPDKRLLHLLPGKLKEEFFAHIGLGSSMGLQRSIVEVGNILVQTGMNGLGTMAIAAVAAGQRIRHLNMLPLFCIGMAVSTFTAQNYGAGKIKRIYQGIRHACIIALGFSFVMALVNFLFGPRLAGLFLIDAPEAVSLAGRYINFIGAALFLLALMLIFRSAMQGAGKNISPTICSILETVMSILTAFLLIPFLGFTGLCLANPLSWLVSGIPLYAAFVLFVREQRRNTAAIELSSRQEA
ncbi:MATE family efflux transporter [Spirochaetia bacterium]|nr:MATE family efflux transporter [Spirochaetia bacterium]